CLVFSWLLSFPTRRSSDLVVLVYESGTLQTKPDVLPLSIGDGDLCETALTTVSVPEMFRYWLQGGKIDVGFLGTAQIDRYCNLRSEEHTSELQSRFDLVCR